MTTDTGTDSSAQIAGILGLLDQAKQLREQIPMLATHTNPDDLDDPMNERAELRNDLQRVSDKLSDQIAECERLKRLLRTARSEQAVDIDKLEAQKWALLRERKRLAISPNAL